MLPRHCCETIKADVRPPLKLLTVLQVISLRNVDVLGEVDVPIQVGTRQCQIRRSRYI